jgi:hypothetical protein
LVLFCLRYRSISRAHFEWLERKKLPILDSQSKPKIVCATEVENHSRMIAIQTNLSLAQPCKGLERRVGLQHHFFANLGPCQTCYGPSDSYPGPRRMCHVLLKTQQHRQQRGTHIDSDGGGAGNFHRE